jgi:competence protein ComEC
MKGNIIYLAISAVFGITFGYFSFEIFLFSLFLVFFLFLFFRKREIFILSLLSMVSYYLYFLYVEEKNVTILSEDMTEFTIRMTSPVTIDGDRLIAIAETSQREKIKVVYRITSKEEKEQLSKLTVGMVCSFKGTLEAPEPARNPNAFNYKKYLYFQRIHWLLKPHSISIGHCYPTPLSMYEKLVTIRQKGIHYIERHFPNETIGIVQALIYGERGQMDDETLKGYQKLGIVHLLAISGLHVSFLTGMCFFLAIRIGLTRESAAMLLIFLLPFYIILTGAAPSVVRASFMAIIVFISIKWPIKLLPVDSISVTCLVMLFMDPYALFRPGFQLSFVVSLALILSVHIVLRQSSALMQLLFTTLIAQLSSLPLLLYHFFEISLLSFPLNLVFIPLYSLFILPLSLLAFIGHYVLEPLGQLFIIILEKMLTLSNALVEFFMSHGSLSFIFGRPTPLLLLCYCIAIFTVFIELEKKNIGIRKCRGILLLFGVMLIDWISPYIDHHGEVVMLDVGQGDCIYIELPYRRSVYLIDTGGVISFQKESWRKQKDKFDVGEDILVPFLKAKGIQKLDKLIITHGDYDHMGAAETLIEQIKVEELLIGKGGLKDALQAQLVTAAKKQHIRVKEVQRGESWNEGGITFYVLAPNGKKEENKNNRSIVLFTTLGGLNWLFTGDLEKSGEEEVIRTFPKLRADVLKVGHHGSETSTSEQFVKVLRPKVALISAGKRNRYGHPHESVIHRLNNHDVDVLRTDIHGAIQFIYSKKSGTFSTMLP